MRRWLSILTSTLLALAALAAAGMGIWFAATHSHLESALSFFCAAFLLVIYLFQAKPAPVVAEATRAAAPDQGHPISAAIAPRYASEPVPRSSHR